ncbi:MAG: aminoglycoside 3-N-acetyltransferase, partial [Kiritimatiellia bacterium]
MPSIRKILSLSPHLEAAVRNVYWGSPILPTLVTRLDDRKAKRKKDRGEKPPSTSIEGIVEQLRAWGVGEGDLLLVHSGYRGIRGGKRSPDDILDQLLNLVGPHGTLCLPSIPYWPEAPKLYDRFVVDYNDIVLDYDPEVTPAWTGAVANAMIKRPQAVRSLHPLNTMAAIGPMAVDMVKNDLNGERPFPNGPQSSWRFCYDNDAWIVAMGADMAHSLTMIHLAEDYLGEQWPVEDWYRDRRFRVKIDGAWQEKVVRERHPRWARYYGERTLSRDLIAAGITRRVQLDGVNVELLRTRELIDYLNRRNHTLYP